ncbi:MAG: hypothetical protein MR270_02515 [Erysipelotrichaceae bacterium]|nr:hypothetical protein [Erysipelotrichaceae bacterium]
MSDKKALASMILGFVGLVAWLLPLVGYPVTIVGLILGIVALKSVDRKKATVGVVLCSICLLATLINSILGVLLQLGQQAA